MSEPTLARRFREWFLRELTKREGYCLGCGAAVTTTGPRGGRVWQFDGHTDDCLLLAIYHRLRGDDMDTCSTCCKDGCDLAPDTCDGPYESPADFIDEDAAKDGE